MGHAKEPHDGHHKLLAELKSTCGRFGLQGISDIEQIAILSQLIGAKVHDLDEREYDSGEVMRSISLNLAQGNAGASGVGKLIGGDFGHG